MTMVDRVRTRLKSEGLEALLVSEPANVQWLTGFSGSFGFALVTPESGRFVTDSRYAIQAGEQVKELPVAWFQNPTKIEDFLAAQVAELGVARVGFEAGHATYGQYRRWAEAFGVDLVPVDDLLGPLRMVKSVEEIAKIEAACRLADAAWDHIRRVLQPGVREIDIALDLEFFMRRQGAEVAFPSIVVSGERSARPHGVPSERALREGDFVTLDFGARLDGYNSDITRTVVIGEPTERHREVYGQVLKAQLAAIEAMKPGVAAAEVDAVARKVLDEIGLASAFGHGLGHGLGRAVHDPGRMSPTSDHVLEVGQVWTVEPGVYLEGFGGVRIEDDVVVEEGGVRLLTHSPKDLLSLPA